MRTCYDDIPHTLALACTNARAVAIGHIHAISPCYTHCAAAQHANRYLHACCFPFGNTLAAQICLSCSTSQPGTVFSWG